VPKNDDQGENISIRSGRSTRSNSIKKKKPNRNICELSTLEKVRQLALDIRNSHDIIELFTVTLEGLEKLITCENVSFILFREDTFVDL
jgi:hypothetical protein